jgi:ABC-type multidrug transport system fused ATPase/permease subunit
VVAYSEQTTKARGYLVDTLTNMGAVRQYAAHDFEKERFGQELQTVRSLNLKQWTISEWGLVINNTIIALFQFAIVAVTISLWKSGTLSTGELVMMVTLLLNVTGTLVFIGSSINSFIRRYAEIEEGLTDVLRDYEIADAVDAKTLSVTQGKVTFDMVNFEFGENNVFADFNLVIQPGQRVGLVGHSGAGKTTFVSLLLRQHDVTSGLIMIDGQDIAQVTQDSLRNAIAVVPQEPMLFHRTIKENIAYGNPGATDEEIIAVAKKAQAHEFISQLEKGYDTLVGERGIKLSGGQKQRVAIARAMLKNAPLLVLDEATSALDSESEVAIQTALHELMEGKTVVAVAHRLSTLREMDRIIVLENGKIIEDGTHDSLKEVGGVYQRLWEHQAGGFLTE